MADADADGDVSLQKNIGEDDHFQVLPHLTKYSSIQVKIPTQYGTTHTHT